MNILFDHEHLFHLVTNLYKIQAMEIKRFSLSNNFMAILLQISRLFPLKPKKLFFLGIKFFLG